MSKLTDAIRAKHPGAYDHVDDATLEKQVLAKYPQYASLMEPEPAKPQEPQRSVGDFLTNRLPASGAKLVSDIVGGLVDAAKMGGPAAGFVNPGAGRNFISALPGLVKQIPGAIKDRYWDNIGDTLYNDPFGVAADAASFTGAGSALKAGKAAKVAGALGKVEKAINPVRLAEPTAKAVEYGTAAAIRPLLSPAKATIRQSRAPLEIERTALREGAATQRGALAKLKVASGKTTKAADEATAAGVTVPRDRVTQFPKTLKETEELTPNIRELDDLAALESETVASLPATLTPSELLTRRRALDKAVDTAYRAEERGGYIRSTRDKGQKELGGNMREALREVAPSVRESDDQARRLGLVVQALENANSRPKGIPMLSALGAGGGYMAAGGPLAATIGAATGVGRNFPQVPLFLGSLPVRGTAAAATVTANPAARQGLLLSALLERLNRD